MNNKLIYFIYILFTLCACKEDETINPNSSNNKMRVSEISGKYSYWENFTYKFFYTNNVIDSAFRYNANNEIVGSLRRNDEDGETSYSFNDKVINMTPTEIEELRQELTDKHGEGNFNLKDSLFYINRALRTIAYQTDDNRLTTSTITDYIPKLDFGDGDNFDNRYTLKSEQRCIYEYDKYGRIIHNRFFHTTYDPENSSISKTNVYKYEYIYDNTNVMTNNIYISLATEANSWKLENSLNYSYEKNMLKSIHGNNYDITYNYQNEKLEINKNGRLTKYTFNQDGYVTKIELANGDYIDIRYETGHGNFEYLLGSIDLHLLGNITIK